MRAIKFRVWDKKQARMCSVAQVHFGDDGSALTITVEPSPKGEYYNGLILGETCELMQYAECTDTDGRDIYDGDLAVSPWTNDITVYQASVDARHGLTWRNLTNGNSTGFMRPEESVRVIGNVWENPEILGKKEDSAAN
jgi:uncharacterized phage protein (TIGR01671 family)